MPSDAPVRLASIVGVDVAGYSARTEADSMVSAREVLALRNRLTELAMRRGGRIFNTAGDGVMMEFAAAREAVAAIFELVDERPAGEPEVRIGAHLGDVTVTENGDLLGHGVNVAARLIALASPGCAIISGELKGVAGGQASRPMRALGEVALAKMKTRIAAFEIAPQAEPAAPAAPAASRPAPAASQKAAVSIAVLPFVNMSSDPEQEYFSDGLSEELLNQLAQIKALRVTGRTSSFAFKGQNEDLRAIGQKLGVGHVLEGSVRKAGKRLRITAQLINCADGYHLWSDTFDRELDDVFAIQEDVARAVTHALGITLGVGETVGMPGGTDNAEAYDLMLRARAIVRRRAPGDAQRAVGLLRQATTLDPDFALGWNVLGNALTSVLTWDPENREAVRQEIDEALEHSMALAPDLWTAHEARANQLELRHDWVAAEQANARSLALAPKSMREPIISRAHQLAVVGRVAEAVPFAREAGRVEPMAPNTTFQVILDSAGRHDEAEAEYERSKDLPRLQLLEDAFAMSRMMANGNHERARERLALCAATDSDPSSPYRAMLEVFDNRQKACAMLQSEINDHTQARLDVQRSTYLMPFASYFGEYELVLSVYRRLAADLIGVQIMSIWHPLHAGMRRLPGFKDLVRDLGLVTYWRTTGNWGDFARPLGADDFEVFR